MDEVKTDMINRRKILCRVESSSMDKSRVASYERLVQHARYKKYIKRRTKLMFHDEKNESKVGDFVYVSESRPYSKRKKYELVGFRN